MQDYDIVLLPTDDFPHERTVQLAKVLREDTNLKIRIDLPVGTNAWKPYPGGKQYDPAILRDIARPAIAELRMSYDRATKVFPGHRSPLYILLTTRDINSADAGLHWVFVESDAQDKVVVISVARMLMDSEGRQASMDTVAFRLRKMALRTIALQYYERPRTADPRDLLYSPLMSLDALDRMNINIFALRREIVGVCGCPGPKASRTTHSRSELDQESWPRPEELQQVDR